jgi:flagellar hook-associated protein 3 FlgL
VGGLSTAEQRLIAAEEVTGIHARLVAISQTAVNGRYIFSGDLDEGPSYASDLSQTAGVVRIQDAPATRQVLEPGGTTFVAGKTAHEIFDARDADDLPTEENVFHAVHRLLAGLQANDSGIIEEAMNAIRASSGHLNGALSHYGIAQNRIEAAITTAREQDLQLKTGIGDIRDADLAEAAIELSQAQLHQQAALAAHANYRPQSLFDYLG